MPLDLTELYYALPLQCVQNMNQSGQRDEDAEYWTEKLKLKLDRQEMINSIAEYGIEREELITYTNKTLQGYCIWLAASYAEQEGEL